ncbi:hypothetical protein TRFO_13805 [Tritrichomonas foetus]|uniref:Chromo domain-containing protein n=1 Tax=Tritrichomonas foetus TaxID=1144522 RepID=A0A1J4L1M8_9EUKA|nr:hypothetical protein TRFO_13805 [Tritrichomonas foetus]|eukprot:OHT15797.1 hypothetical protein TRFO_13805 [Tritrichomonas foetus]
MEVILLYLLSVKMSIIWRFAIQMQYLSSLIPFAIFHITCPSKMFSHFSSSSSVSSYSSDVDELIVGMPFESKKAKKIAEEEEDQNHKNRNLDFHQITKSETLKSEASKKDQKKSDKDQEKKEKKKSKYVPVLIPKANPVESINNHYSESDYEEEEEETYEVEAIINHRKKHGKIQYFLKWVGYPSSQNTWEFENNMNCPELIKEYWDRKKDEMSSRQIDLDSKKSANEKIDEYLMKSKAKKDERVKKPSASVLIFHKLKSKSNNSNSNHNSRNSFVDNSDFSQNINNENLNYSDIHQVPKLIKKSDYTSSKENLLSTKTFPSIRQFKLPLYQMEKPQFCIKSIIDHQIENDVINYRILLNNEDVIILKSDEVQMCNPRLLIDYYEKFIL